MDSQQLFSEFREVFKDKYEFREEESLGIGHDVIAYKAFDIDRQVDVAVKLHLEGVPPAGSERDWKFTSGTIHPQIASTFTIESFKASDGEIYKVVVARFIPGKTLGTLQDGVDDCDDTLQIEVAANMAEFLIPSLHNAIEVIHSVNFGHGELTANNIMTFLTDEHPGYGFFVVLLDFDNNAPSTRDGAQNTNKALMESDIRQVKKFMLEITRFLPWADVLKRLLEEYSQIRQIKNAYTFLLAYLKLIRRKEHTTYNISELLKTLYLDLGPHYYGPLMAAIRAIAQLNGLEDAFNLGFDQFEKNKKAYDFQRRAREMTVYEDIGPISDFYKKIFG